VIRRALLCGLVVAGCGGDRILPPTEATDRPSYPGFDIGVYPGDDAVRAWRYPASPFYWIGYYLPAPCHRDVSFAGKQGFITSLGWGITAIYVGQQDWANIPNLVPGGARASRVAASAVTCSASLLSSSQGTTEAADAVAKLAADGFLHGSTVFLDVEHVSRITQPLLDYYRAWVNGVLADGRYTPGIYASRTNAPTFHAQTFLDSRGVPFEPAFWIAGSGAFTMSSLPADVGLSFADLWQGMFEVTQTYGAVKLNIDVNVATKRSPSAP
jgi:hypothetical protein